jgi:hypothetical protein
MAAPTGYPMTQSTSGPPGTAETPQRVPPQPGGGAPFLLVTWLLIALILGGLGWVTANGVLSLPGEPAPTSVPATADGGAAVPSGEGWDQEGLPDESVSPQPPPSWSASSSSSSTPTPRGDIAPVGSWVLILDSKKKTEWTLDETRQAARNEFGVGVQVYDSDATPGLNHGYWAVAYGRFSTEDAARASCSDVGLSPSGQCYPRYIG